MLELVASFLVLSPVETPPQPAQRYANKKWKYTNNIHLKAKYYKF
jgi:hypothetical protein